MTASPPSRPWWKRKRTRAAVTLWLLLPPLWIAGVGPSNYVVARGWMPAWLQVEVAPLVIGPANWFFAVTTLDRTRIYDGWLSYGQSCRDAGTRHAASD